MICCGEDRSTPFCPMCGHSIESEHAKALSELLRHAEKSLKMSDSNMRRHKQRMQSCEEKHKSHHLHASLKCASVSCKWSRWVDAIKEAMKK